MPDLRGARVASTFNRSGLRVMTGDTTMQEQSTASPAGSSLPPPMRAPWSATSPGPAAAGSVHQRAALRTIPTGTSGHPGRCAGDSGTPVAIEMPVRADRGDQSRSRSAVTPRRLVAAAMERICRRDSRSRAARLAEVPGRLAAYAVVVPKYLLRRHRVCSTYTGCRSGRWSWPRG